MRPTMTAVIIPRHPHSPRPLGGLGEVIDDITRKDDADGPSGPEDRFHHVLNAVNSHRGARSSRPAGTRQDPEAALGRHLLAAARAHDARIPAHRRAPRTLAEMTARLTAVGLADVEQDACDFCGRWSCICGQQSIGGAVLASVS